jgi:hypothetical protein
MSYGLAFFAKQPALVDIFAVVCFVCAQALFKKTTWKHAIQRLSILLSGFLTILVSVLGFFFWRDGLQDFVFYFWTYNTKYYITTAGFTERFNIGLDFFRYLFQYFPVFAICFLSGEVYIVLRFIHANGQKNDHNHDPQLLFAIWAIGALTVPILSGRIPSFGHYYIQLLPALSVVCGIAAHDFMQAFLSWFSSPPDHQNRMPQRILVGLGLVLCLLVFLMPMTLLLSQRFSASFPRHASNPFEQEAVKYIQEQTAPADSIFVWGFFPELYVLANRRPASRYTFTNVLTGFIPWEHMEPEYDTSATIVPGTWDILMEELHTNKPVLIIDTSPGQYRGYGKYPPQKFPPLHDFLNTYYEVAHEIVSDTKLVALRIFKRRTG